MRYWIHRPNHLGVACAVFAGIVAAVIAASGALLVAGDAPAGAATSGACSGVHIYPGNDLDAKVNRDPGDRATTFCVHAPSSGATYHINNTLQLKSGDKLIGQPGQVITRGPASYGVPPVKIRNGGSLPRLIQLSGPDTKLRWLDVAGAAVKYRDGRPDATTGTAIGAAGANAAARMKYLAVHDNPNAGIGSMNGRLVHSNLYNNGTNSYFHGYSATAVKGVDEYEAAYNFIHDNPANGLWCDYGCKNKGSAMPNGFWAHHNLVVNNGRWGIRYEYSAIVKSGVRTSSNTAYSSNALVESNEIHANGYKGGYGGASAYDAQNAIFRNNSFGAKTIAGVSYGANNNRRAIYFGDSGSHRTDLWNADAVGNSLGGHTIDGCSKLDAIVRCAKNR